MKYLQLSFDTKLGVDCKVSFAFGLIMSMRFINYAYCFAIGSFMKINNVKGAYGEDLNGADIFIVMQVIIVAITTFGMITFYANFVLKAAGASTVIFDVIDAETDVDPTKEGIKAENLKGCYKFEKVNFRYPTRPDLLILDNLTLTMEAGQTTAFVGPSGSGKSTIIQ